MYCFRCGTKVDENTMYCPHCGANIKEEQERYSYPPIKKQENIDKKRINATHQEQYDYSLKYSYGDKEELIKEYVGKEYNKIKNTKFSIPTFLFVPFYFLYRKLYTIGLLWLLLIIIFSWIFPTILFFISLILSTTFTYIYLSVVTKKVEEIKKENKNLDKDTIKQRCKTKGGVNYIIPIILIILVCSIIITSTYILIPNYIEPKPSKKDTTDSIKNISYTIPKGFTKSKYESENYKSYSYTKDDKYCNIGIEAYDYKSLYKDAEEYIKANVYVSAEDTINPIDKITLNNTTWIHMSTENEYQTKDIYAKKEGNTFYKIETRNTKYQPSCTEEYQKILNSITEKEQ